MEGYVESAKYEINSKIRSYSESKATDEWKSAATEYKKISYKVEEVIYGNGKRHTNNVSLQAIRFSCDIPDDWAFLENILMGYNAMKILPCILFTWLCNVDKNICKRIQGLIKNHKPTFKDKRIADLIAKNKSKEDYSNSEGINHEINIADLFLDNVSEIPQDCDLAFMMVIRFLTLFGLHICKDADEEFCISWFENKYGVLKYIFTYEENENNKRQSNKLIEIEDAISRLKDTESSLVNYYKDFNESTRNIRNKIELLDFGNKNSIEKEVDSLLNKIKEMSNYTLLFMYEVFKANYALNRPSLNDALVQMCQFFDADLYAEKLIIGESEIEEYQNNNAKSTFILTKIISKIEEISELHILCDEYNGGAIIHYSDNDNEYDYERKSKLTDRMAFSSISRLNMLYSSWDITLSATLKILSAKYFAYDSEFKLSCEKFNVNDTQLINARLIFKENSNVLKCKDKKGKWFDAMFLLFANEVFSVF